MKNGILFTLTGIALIIIIIGPDNIMNKLGYKKVKNDTQRSDAFFNSYVVLTTYEIIDDLVMLRTKICKREEQFTKKKEGNSLRYPITYTINDKNGFILGKLYLNFNELEIFEEKCFLFNGVKKININNKLIKSIDTINIDKQ